MLCRLFTGRGTCVMKEYEVLIESINPCGGAANASKEFLEIETDDPAAYVREHSPYPVRCCGHNKDGNLVIATGNEQGYQTNYTFIEG